ncbi:MFS transporter [Bacillus cereus]|uniref:MFS transporter n=1 Tax=Bacillus cereus TaxID=1396 RepID=A0AAW5L9E8_BACCE|nr:MFS transporter [Bacillus cereus]MCQ6289068.1 MFS transporter [Bacillus cereus]MCQ6307394.1 MFS transporter [Bacillus cereus]MCQ6318542.1 MFS transporter [Bacillus cereus]MCQ6330810.1 MFS transporter [Bacillus cereus]MCQ6386101.1 MFS transporter [Bacillus cereus]
MLKPFCLRLGNFQFFNSLEGGGEVVTETVPPSDLGGELTPPQGTGEITEPTGQIEQSPIENNPEGQPPEAMEQSEAFAKRLQERTQAALMEERGRWEQEAAERYGNYDQYNRAMNFFMKQAGYNDLDSMMQAIEQQDLLQRAEKFGVTPEIQQKLEALEQKAQRAEELEYQREQQELSQRFTQALGQFAQEKGADAAALEQFMLEQNVPHFEVAYNAMRTQQLEEQLTSAKETAIQEYLQSKKAPKVEGPGVTGLVSDEPTTDFQVARERALQRLRSANQQI